MSKTSKSPNQFWYTTIEQLQSLAYSDVRELTRAKEGKPNW